MKAIRFFMKNGAVWDVPVSTIARYIATQRIMQQNGKVSEADALRDAETMSDKTPQLAFQWARARLSWAHMRGDAKLVHVNAMTDGDFEDAFKNGPTKIVEYDQPPTLADTILADPLTALFLPTAMVVKALAHLGMPALTLDINQAFGDEPSAVLCVIVGEHAPKFVNAISEVQKSIAH